MRQHRLQRILERAATLESAARRLLFEQVYTADEEQTHQVLRFAEGSDRVGNASCLPLTGRSQDLGNQQFGGERSCEIVSSIGEGGMGTVYLARRTEDHLEYFVALKVVRQRSGGDREMLRRFRTERQILAGLDHPNIARLIDVGSTADGSPFLVMEYVEGERFDRYCNQHQLGINERLQLIAEAEASSGRA